MKIKELFLQFMGLLVFYIFASGLFGEYDFHFIGNVATCIALFLIYYVYGKIYFYVLGRQSGERLMFLDSLVLPYLSLVTPVLFVHVDSLSFSKLFLILFIGVIFSSPFFDRNAKITDALGRQWEASDEGSFMSKKAYEKEGYIWLMGGGYVLLVIVTMAGLKI